jgi:hypothetical protein
VLIKQKKTNALRNKFSYDYIKVIPSLTEKKNLVFCRHRRFATSSQERATGLYREPVEPNPHPHAEYPENLLYATLDYIK